MEYKFIPSPKEGREAVWSGYVMINVPNASERLALNKQIQFSNSGQGEIESSSVKGVDVAMILVDAANKYIVSCDITHIPSGTKFTNKDDIGFYDVGLELLSEVGVVVVQGIKLGKS
jgi:hypothetical protein